MTSRGRSQLRRLRLPDGEGGGVRTVPCTPHVHSMLNNGGGRFSHLKLPFEAGISYKKFNFKGPLL